MRYLILALSILLTTTNSYSQALRLNRVSIFTDNTAVLEFEGKLPIKNGNATYILPDSLVHGSLKVESLVSGQNIKVSLIDLVKDVEKPISNLKEFLNGNVGKQVDIEAVEGKETISYSGTIIALRTDGELLLLKSKDKIEAIPIGVISHASFPLGSKAVIDQLTTIKSVQISALGLKDSIPVRIIYAANTMSATSRYTLNSEDNNSKLTLEVALENKGIQGKDVAIYLLNSSYSSKSDLSQLAYNPLYLGNSDLYESVNQLFKVIEKDVNAGIVFNLNGNIGNIQKNQLKLKTSFQFQQSSHLMRSAISVDQGFPEHHVAATFPIYIRILRCVSQAIHKSRIACDASRVQFGVAAG